MLQHSSQENFWIFEATDKFFNAKRDSGIKANLSLPYRDAVQIPTVSHLQVLKKEPGNCLKDFS